VQLVACSATASFRLREELCRLFSIEHEADLGIITPATPKASAKQPKRSTGARGIGGIGVPATITHWWVPCGNDHAKWSATKAALDHFDPRCALLFLADDAPLKGTVEGLQSYELTPEHAG
jgi:hypothetical protein